MSASLEEIEKSLAQLQVEEKETKQSNSISPANSNVTISSPPVVSLTAASPKKKSTSRVISIDVEALASGKTHLYTDRAPCWVALVNDITDEVEPLLDMKMKPPTIVDYLSELSGVNEHDLKDAPSLDDGLKHVHSLLGPDVTIVGWNVQGDIDWLQLKQGVHYKEAIDCIMWFTHMQRGYKGKEFLRRYSLAHVSRVLLEFEVRSGGNAHSPVNDALATLQLYEKFKEKGPKLTAAIHSIRTTEIIKSHAAMNTPTLTGVCMSPYDNRFCICGQPSRRTD